MATRGDTEGDDVPVPVRSPVSEERAFGLRLALIAAGSALLGSVIAVAGQGVLSERQAARADEDRLRDRRESVHTELLDYERRNLDRTLAEVVAEVEELEDAEDGGVPRPEPVLDDDRSLDEQSASKEGRALLTALLEHGRLSAETQVYGSPEVQTLFDAFCDAQVRELGALQDAALDNEDDDEDADQRAESARTRQEVANEMLIEQVRDEVGSG
jgi:hypothetical protein